MNTNVGTRKMAANPYIRPSWESNYENIKQTMIEKFMELILSA